MEPQTTIKPRWTASRLLKVGLAGFFVSLFGTILAALLWWPLAFDWDSNKLPILAYLDIAFGVVAALGVIASIIAMIASGIMAIVSYGKSVAYQVAGASRRWRFLFRFAVHGFSARRGSAFFVRPLRTS